MLVTGFEEPHALIFVRGFGLAGSGYIDNTLILL